MAANLTAGIAEDFSWTEGKNHRSSPVQVENTGRSGFTVLQPTALGIQFTNRLSRAVLARRFNLGNGSGVALGDVNNDGRCDIYFCRLEGENELYLNQGNWRFQKARAASAPCRSHFTRGAAFADIDGDADLDLLLTTFRKGTLCFLNDGKGRFTDNTGASGLGGKTSGTTLALGDVDLDGDLDLYVVNFAELSLLHDRGSFAIQTIDGVPRVSGMHAKRLKIIGGNLVEFGEPDSLYLNNGSGRFEAVPWGSTRFIDENGEPMVEPMDFGLCAQIRDINQDSFPDIYVCNDFQTPDRMWLNDGTGHFRALKSEAIRSVSYASMGVDFADIDRDGQLDFFVVEMLGRDLARRLLEISPHDPGLPYPGRFQSRLQVSRNTLFWNRGDGSYAEVGRFAGLEASGWSWMPVFLDIDLDGLEDLLITNGHIFDIQNQDAIERANKLSQHSKEIARNKTLLYPPLLVHNLAFRNLGQLQFEEASNRWGFNSLKVSHGIATGDLDNDGDLDLVINCLNLAPIICRNEADAPRLAVRLKGRVPNTHCIGGRVRVTGGPFTQEQEIIAGSRYLSSDEPMRVFAVGNTNTASIEVIWPGGGKTVVTNAGPNRVYEIIQPDPVPLPVGPATASPDSETFFEDVSHLLSHTHSENHFNDLARQPLLPWRLDRAGPGLAWFDWNGDGREDLFIATGRGGAPTLFQNTGTGGFVRVQLPARATNAAGDLLGLGGWHTASGTRSLLVTVSGYENPDVALLALLEYVNPIRITTRVLSGTNPGPLATADIDADGDLDLFVGGQAVSGHWPKPTRSLLLRNNEGQLTPDPSPASMILGLVTAALFSDLTNDGFPELVVACEWGPIRVFENRNGSFVESTARLGLLPYTGLWQGLAAADFNSDGLVDIVASNWGLNSELRASMEHPLRLYHGRKNTGPVVAQWDEKHGRYLPLASRNLLASFLPGLVQRFSTHKAFAEAGLNSVILGHHESLQRSEVAVLTSTVFLNRGGRFEPQALPPRAQWSAAFGIRAGDLDGDGHIDLLLAQNFAAFPTEKDRLDAGRGLWLRGDGAGGFSAVPGHKSGIIAHGDQRGCSLADYDQDGRLDIALSQNGSETKLFRNRSGRLGLRVRLRGFPANPQGIGAAARLWFGQRPGIWRQWQGAGGRYAQDGSEKIFAQPIPANYLEIRWPGGKTTHTPVPSGKRMITVDATGKLIN